MTAEALLPSPPRLFLITGNMAAGKSTVAQALAERLPRSVHVRGDLFRRMIVNGRADMGFDLSAEAEAQLRLRQRLAAGVARGYLEAGFTVVYQDILIGADLARAAESFRDLPLSVIVLCPSPEVVAARDRTRGKTGYTGDAMVRAFDHVLRAETPRLGYWLDSSSLDVAATVDTILAHLPEASVPPG